MTKSKTKKPLDRMSKIELLKTAQRLQKQVTKLEAQIKATAENTFKFLGADFGKEPGFTVQTRPDEQQACETYGVAVVQDHSLLPRNKMPWET